MSNRGTHIEHCCRDHGCKYSDDDCPVLSGEKQAHPCEHCEDDHHVYDIGFSTYEESSYSQFVKTGPKLTELELRDIVKQCLLVAWEAIPEEQASYRDNFQDLLAMEEFYDELKKHGFTHLEFAATWSVFGWAKAAVPGDSCGVDKDGNTRELQEWMAKHVTRQPTKEDDDDE